MSAGLFALICPQCNGELEIDRGGRGICPRCRRAYLTRFGHLIPADELGDGSTFAPKGLRRGEA